MAEPSPSQPAAPATRRVPGIYFNGFGIAVGNSDFSISVALDNQPVAELKGSYTTIKTLAEKLLWAVQHFEKATNRQILTTDEVGALLSKADLSLEADTQTEALPPPPSADQ